MSKCILCIGDYGEGKNSLLYRSCTREMSRSKLGLTEDPKLYFGQSYV